MTRPLLLVASLLVIATSVRGQSPAPASQVITQDAKDFVGGPPTDFPRVLIVGTLERSGDTAHVTGGIQVRLGNSLLTADEAEWTGGTPTDPVTKFTFRGDVRVETPVWPQRMR